jgi:uncharacterized integral membrane protein
MSAPPPISRSVTSSLTPAQMRYLNSFLLSVVAGSLLMLFQMFRRSLHLWPVVQRITD